MLDVGDLTMLDYVESIERRAKFDREALQPKTYAEDRQEVWVW